MPGRSTASPRRRVPASLRVLALALALGGLLAAVGGQAVWCCVPAALAAFATCRSEGSGLVGAALVTAAALAGAATGGHAPSAALVAAIAAVSVAVAARLRRRLEGEARALRESALRDPLTGLANRRAFAERMTYEVARHTRNERPFAVLALDLDGFKRVNDRFGHQAGDELLADVAAALHAAVRSQDTVARLGGDEFAVLAPETGTQGAERLADRVDLAIRRVTAGLQAVSASVGVGLFPRDGEDGSAVLEAADAASMELKRRAGRERERERRAA